MDTIELGHRWRLWAMATLQIWAISMHNDQTLFCRVCGLEQPYPQYGDNGNSPTYEICACCGVEFGYEDTTVQSAQKFRENWIGDGLKWFSPSEKPANWSWEEQKAYIPESFR